MNGKNLNGKPPRSKINSTVVALSWLELGISPIPIRPRSKRPKGGEGWNKLRVTEKTIPQHFRPGDNVGGLWGSPSDWIVDIDLDWTEAAIAARTLLPKTFTYGRLSRPETHYLYRCKDAQTLKRIQPGKEGTVIVELRSTGSQSVLPPSIHPEGERFEINADRPFTNISKRDLERRVNRVAAAALLARLYPRGGGRHDFIHALVGALVSSRWRADDIYVFVGAVLDAAGGKEDDRAQRERTITNTIEHAAQEGHRVAGWRTLAQWVTGENLRCVKEWVGAKDRAEIPEAIPRPPVEDVKLPIELVDVPGLVGEIAKWAGGRSYAEQPSFALAVGLICTALASGNRYVIEHWETPLQPFFLLLAPTASGKESALEAVYTFSRRIGLGQSVFQGFQSYHAMLDRLVEPPHTACWLWDEAARKLKSSGRSQGGQDYQILTWLMSFYGKANSFVAGMPGRKQAISSIDYPFLTVLAAAQPTQMIEAITDSDLSMGLINRFVLFDAGNDLPKANLKRHSFFPSKIEEAVKQFRHVDLPKGEDPFVRIKFDGNEPWALFRDFNDECRELAIRGGGWEMWGRTNQNALILAGLVAVGCNPLKPIITSSIAKWAIGFLSWSSNRWTLRVEDSSARTVTEVYSKHIERLIRNGPGMIHRCLQGEEPVLKRGLVPRSMIARLSRHLRGRDLDDALHQLVMADLVGTGDIEGVEVYWAK